MLGLPRADNVKKKPLAPSTFRQDGHLKLQQKVPQPLVLRLIVLRKFDSCSRCLRCRELCDRAFNEHARDRFQRKLFDRLSWPSGARRQLNLTLRRFENAGLTPWPTIGFWSLARPCPRQFRNPICLKDSTVDVRFFVVKFCRQPG